MGPLGRLARDCRLSPSPARPLRRSLGLQHPLERVVTLLRICYVVRMSQTPITLNERQQLYVIPCGDVEFMVGRVAVRHDDLVAQLRAA